MPSLLTPRQLTRFSCPLSEPTLSPRRTSQTCEIVSIVLEIFSHSLTYLALKVIVASKEQTPGNGECHGGNSAEDLVALRKESALVIPSRCLPGTYLVRVQLAVRANIKQAARRIIRTSAKGVAVWEELNGIDIRLVTRERLNSLASSNIPELGKSVAGARHEDVLVSGVDANGHDIAQVIRELGHLGPGFNIPQHAGHVAGRGQDAAVIDEAAAGQVAGVTRQLSRHTGRTLARR